jgi:hypothetical protein
MTTGALIFAFNNGHIDYLAMAEWTARNIRRHLNIPVAVITDQPTVYEFDQVIISDSPCDNARWFDDYATRMPWNNQLRTNAYELTPWDQTLVLDADYVVASDQLRSVLETDQDFVAHRWAYDVTGCNNFENLNYFGNNRMPMWWATVMMFRKSRHAELIFDAMQMIRDNWTHYRNLYKNSTPTYRNDHALSIALGIVNGHTLDHTGIPWALASLTPGHKLTQLDQDRYRVDFTNTENQARWIELRQDFHAMGKQQLGAIVANPC